MRDPGARVETDEYPPDPHHRCGHHHCHCQAPEPAHQTRSQSCYFRWQQRRSAGRTVRDLKPRALCVQWRDGEKKGAAQLLRELLQQSRTFKFTRPHVRDSNTGRKMLNVVRTHEIPGTSCECPGLCFDKLDEKKGQTVNKIFGYRCRDTVLRVRSKARNRRRVPADWGGPGPSKFTCVCTACIGGRGAGTWTVRNKEKRCIRPEKGLATPKKTGRYYPCFAPAQVTGT